MQEMQEMQVWFLGQEDPLEEEMATCSNILAWKIPRTEEPGGVCMVHSVAKSWTWLKQLTTTQVLFSYHIDSQTTLKGFSDQFKTFIFFQFSSVQLLSHVRLFATPWIAAR